MTDPTSDTSQPPAPPGCVFGPALLSGAWVAVVEGAGTGTLAGTSFAALDTPRTRADIVAAEDALRLLGVDP